MALETRVEGVCVFCPYDSELGGRTQFAKKQLEENLAKNPCAYVKEGLCRAAQLTVGMTAASSALERAQIITDKREPIDVYIDLEKQNLRRSFRRKYPNISARDLNTLVNNQFYGPAFSAFLADNGGEAQTDGALTEMLKQNLPEEV